MINSRLIADRHGNFFSDPIEYYRGKEDAVGGQGTLKHKAAESFLKEENYKGEKEDQGIIKCNHYKAKAQAGVVRQLPSYAYFFIEIFI